MRIHLLVNTHRADAVQAAKSTVQLLYDHKISVGADHESAPYLNVEPIVPLHMSDADLVISFGGDGTLIKAAALCSEKGTPILGVYYGRFGFVTQCVGSDTGVCLSQFIDGQAFI